MDAVLAAASSEVANLSCDTGCDAQPPSKDAADASPVRSIMEKNPSTNRLRGSGTSHRPVRPNEKRHVEKLVNTSIGARSFP
jgi:hypothetical protein